MHNVSNLSVREAALNIVVRVGEGGGYSNLLLNQTLKKERFKANDSALLTELVYGTLQRRDTLAYFLAPFVKKKVKPWVKWLLYLSVYQMVYLKKVPDHAVIFESVELGKKKGHKGISSLINGVLRNVQRNGVPSLDQIEDPVERLATETSHPVWLVKRMVNWYGLETTKAMCLRNLERKNVTVRVQALKTSREEVIETLINDGFDVAPSPLSPQGIIMEQGNILQHSLFQNHLTVQDESSMLVGEMMGLAPGMEVLDACSAPGGKTTHMAEIMENEGTIYAYDLHAKKAKLVEQKAKALGLTIVEAKQGDSRNLRQFHENKTFDRILLDAPCSGLGVLSGKPEIKYEKSEADIINLARIQYELLEAVAPLLKDDGKLVYSTCTVDKEENEYNVKRFLEQHEQFEVDPDFHQELPEICRNLPGLSEWGLQLFPQDLNTDGFFLTRLRKKE
ncbi:16S rRNA (cytosine(967)-C(5))-methyltransferase RsmB [Salirhabdus salicampi]|uniref:16S rRNA (cytosine(967)-C(5))-methyltransferase RsmB n=1 Tax=Salirhabdus salicampi TaxID=476102 RepID=UPI0020C54345|nr:16S rRNA (cytosine(967)-C(5))-methyltransferase RsmB [Salirhabdus salicampi]MCP8616571.1 16S rRNA (cytosine(967)-C(5))-methyltransferase RsmB [Salirhabdus salicampi]